MPRTDDVLARVRAGIIIAACLSIAMASVLLIATWFMMGDLSWETAVAAGAIIAILSGIGALARAGRVPLASWAVTILLTVLISAEAWSFGAGSASSAAFAIPIILAAATLGLWPSLGIASFGSGVLWLSAWAETRNWYTPLMTPDGSHLTFNAPALTVIFMSIAIIAGSWTHYAVESSRRLTLITRWTEKELGPLAEGIGLAGELEGTFDFEYRFDESGRRETWVRCYLRPYR